MTLGTAAVLLASLPVGMRAEATEVPPAEPPKPKWERSAAAGLTLTRGNSDTILFTANVLALRKAEQNELSLGADGTYGEDNDTKNNETLHGFAQYNRLFGERWYGYLRVDMLHDAIADVDYRLTVGPGAGYYFIKNERTRLSAEVGPSFIHEKVGSEENSYLALRVGEKFEHKLSDRARIWQSLEWLPQVDDFDNFILIAEIGIEADITKKLSLRTFLQDTYDNDPAPEREKNDLKLVSGIAYKF